MNGAELIAAERQRQIEQEGWTVEHDDQHDDRELAQAAECYIDRYLWGCDGGIPHYWPFDSKWWKPGESDNRVRDLVKAGALIAAEIDRLQRIEQES